MWGTAAGWLSAFQSVSSSSLPKDHAVYWSPCCVSCIMLCIMYRAVYHVPCCVPCIMSSTMHHATHHLTEALVGFPSGGTSSFVLDCRMHSTVVCYIIVKTCTAGLAVCCLLTASHGLSFMARCLSHCLYCSHGTEDQLQLMQWVDKPQCPCSYAASLPAMHPCHQDHALPCSQSLPWSPQILPSPAEPY